MKFKGTSQIRQWAAGDNFPFGVGVTLVSFKKERKKETSAKPQMRHLCQSSLGK